MHAVIERRMYSTDKRREVPIHLNYHGLDYARLGVIVSSPLPLAWASTPVTK
jgi:hypothetical protein